MAGHWQLRLSAALYGALLWSTAGVTLRTQVLRLSSVDRCGAAAAAAYRRRQADSAARQAVGPGGHGGPGSPGLLRLSIWHLGAQAIEVLVILLAVLWMYLEI